MSNTESRVERRLDIQCYLQDLLYALDHGAKVSFQEDRQVDQKRDIRFTNKYTVADLFPDEDPVDAIKRELRCLKVEEYIQTVKDTRFKNKSEMREFGKVYDGNKDVYIKIRVELLSNNGNHIVFVMSFHYAETPFTDDMFPFRN